MLQSSRPPSIKISFSGEVHLEFFFFYRTDGACKCMNSIGAIISPIQKELLEFHKSVPHSRQGPLIAEDHHSRHFCGLEGRHFLC